MSQCYGNMVEHDSSPIKILGVQHLAQDQAFFTLESFCV